MSCTFLSYNPLWCISSSFRAASVCAASSSVALRSCFVHLQVKRLFSCTFWNIGTCLCIISGICLFPELCLMNPRGFPPFVIVLSICITSVTSALLSGHCTFSMVGTCRCVTTGTSSLQSTNWAGLPLHYSSTLAHQRSRHGVLCPCNFDGLPLRRHLPLHVHGDVALCVDKLLHVSLHCLWTVWAVGSCLCDTTGTSCQRAASPGFRI